MNVQKFRTNAQMSKSSEKKSQKNNSFNDFNSGFTIRPLSALKTDSLRKIERNQTTNPQTTRNSVIKKFIGNAKLYQLN